MPKMPQVWASRPGMQREQTQAPGRFNTPKPPHKLKPKESLEHSPILPRNKPGRQAGPRPKRHIGHSNGQNWQSEIGNKDLSKSPLSIERANHGSLGKLSVRPSQRELHTHQSEGSGYGGALRIPEPYQEPLASPS